MSKMTNINTGKIMPLPSFNELCKEIPLSRKATEVVSKGRREIQRIINGKDKRKILIIGPCAPHDVQETYEFAKLLAPLVKKKSDKFVITIRICLDKPRTKKDWPGMATDPHLDGSFDIAHGYRVGRKLMLDILELGIPIACEMLDANNYNVISDMVSYAWVGARTVSSPGTRMVASGITAPVGVKNSNHKDTVDDVINALDVITNPGVFPGTGNDGVLSRVPTKGNKYTHIVLRGGRSGPNYCSKQIIKVREELSLAGYIDRVLIDCSHGNCDGDYNKQIEVFESVCHRIKKGEEGIIGLMMEVYHEGGKQHVKLGVPMASKEIKPKLSVMDKCLSFVDFKNALEKGYEILS